MAKTVKCKGQILLTINALLPRFPQEKVNEAGYKILNFFRAVKKPLRKFLDEQSELQKEARKATEDITVQIRKLNQQAQSKDEEAKKVAEGKLEKLNKEFEKKVEPFNEKLKALNEAFTDADFEVVFDTEEFNFSEQIFKEKPVDFFGFTAKDAQGNDVKATDFEAMSQVMDFFESAQ